MASGATVELEATIEAGPPTVSSGTFPRSSTSIPFGFKGPKPPAPRQTGSMTTEVSSAGAFVALEGVGTGKTVTKATVVFLQTALPMQVRLTFKDPGGGADIVSIVPIDGPLVLQLDPNGYCKLVEIKGLGTVNWYASGAE